MEKILMLSFSPFNNMAAVTKEQQAELDSALFKKLEQLTMKIPSDPLLYKDEVEKYSTMFKEEFEKLLSDIQRKNQRFSELLIFLSRCVRHFPKNLAYVPKQVIDLLKNHGPNLHPYARKKCVGSIMILRAKNILYPVETIQFLLTLFNIEDKELRKILYKYILNDVRRMNKHHKNTKINQQLRNFIYENIIKNSDKMTQKSLQLMIDLYKRNIWTDNRSVNIIAEGCFNQSPKIRMIAAYFLISTTQPLEQLEESDSDEAVNPSQIKLRKGITKHGKNKQKQIQKEKKRAERRLRKKEIQGRRQHFMPIDIIYSPQDFAEKLFNFMLKKNIKFAHKLVYMALISRLIWRHKLIILPWYGSLIKYLEPKQKQVHKILTYFAESVHDNLPDDEVETVVKHIIQKFVNDRCTEFAMTIGLNTIREVYAKLSSIINQDTMLYLTTYYDYKNKNVRAAAKALINLVREINPYLLEKKYRGRSSNEPVDLSKVGKEKVKTTIEGAELLDYKGDIPIYLDRILTDEDFKQIKKLKKKQQEQKQWQNIRDMEEEENQQDESLEENEENDEEEEQSEEDESQNQQIDWQDCEQIEELVEGDGDQQQMEDDEVQQQEEEDEEGDSQQQQNEEDNSQLQIEGEDEQSEQEVEQNEQIDGLDQEQSSAQDQSMKEESSQVPKKKKNHTQIKENHSKVIEEKRKNNNNTKKIEAEADQSDSYEESQSDPNPHGFLSVDQIAFYKKSKTQIKSERKRNNQKKEKYKRPPKDKKGGSTNKQKLKFKPLLMLRAKKNKIRSQQKQVKLKIKNLKNQLGRVKSGKEAKRLKNKKITKKPKRR